MSGNTIMPVRPLPGNGPWSKPDGWPGNRPADRPLSDLAAAFALGDRSRRVGHAVAAVAGMRLPFPPQLAAMGDFMEATCIGDDLRTRGSTKQIGCLLLDPTGSGKSTAAQAFVEMLSADAPPDEVPAVYARVPQNGTAIGLMQNMLAATGDHHANLSRENRMLEHLLTRLREVRARIIFIDEADKGAGGSGDGGRIAGQTVGTARLLMDEGIAPVVLLGTALGVGSMADDRELAGRLLAPTSLAPLAWYEEYDREIWIDLLDALDAKLVTEDVCRTPFGLGDPKLAEDLMTASNGTIGQLFGIMRSAVREMARVDRTDLLMEDLVYAIDSWSIGFGFLSSNPLR